MTTDDPTGEAGIAAAGSFDPARRPGSWLGRVELLSSRADDLGVGGRFVRSEKGASSCGPAHDPLAGDGVDHSPKMEIGRAHV